MKTCTKCGESKALDCFSKKQSRCKPCAVLVTKEWQMAHPDRKREMNTEYRDRNRDVVRRRGRERYYALMETDPERVRANRRAAAKTPKGVIANRAARHARRGAPLTPEAKAWWLSLVNPMCHYCPEPAVEIDHVVPISKGGTGDLSNLVPACRTCNARKNDSAEWEGIAGSLLTLAS